MSTLTGPVSALEEVSRLASESVGPWLREYEGYRGTFVFVDGSAEDWLTAGRIDTPHTHGTGCTLSSAIAAALARGSSLPEAVRAGKAFVTEAIRHALELGEGIGPVDQLWAIGDGAVSGPAAGSA